MSNLKYDGLGLRLKELLDKRPDIDFDAFRKQMTDILKEDIVKRTGSLELKISPLGIGAIIDGRFLPDETYLDALSKFLSLTKTDKEWLFYGQMDSSYKMAAFNGCEEITEEDQKQTNEHVDELFKHYNG